MENKNNTQNSIYDAVEQLWTFSRVTPENYTIINEYKEELESKKDHFEFLVKYNETKKPEELKQKIAELEAEIKWFEDNVRFYRDTRVSVLDMHQITSHLFWKNDDHYYDAFFDFIELVQMINCYFNIKEPNKPYNRVAFGWNYSMTKERKVFRQYLYGCIRNYLNSNGVTFETKTLQKICSLKDVEHEDM